MTVKETPKTMQKISVHVLSSTKEVNEGNTCGRQLRDVIVSLQLSFFFHLWKLY